MLGNEDYIGRRYERLLFGGILVFAASMIAVVLTLAGKFQANRTAAECLDAGRVAIAARIAGERGSVVSADLQSAYRQARTMGAASPLRTAYITQLTTFEDYEDLACFETMRSYAHRLSYESPANVVILLKQMATLLRNEPLKVVGVEVPAVVRISFAKSEIGFSTSISSLFARIILPVVVVVWIMMLLVTRIAEMRHARETGEIFPHAMNVLLVCEDRVFANWILFLISIVQAFVYISLLFGPAVLILVMVYIAGASAASLFASVFALIALGAAGLMVHFEIKLTRGFQNYPCQNGK